VQRQGCWAELGLQGPRSFRCLAANGPNSLTCWPPAPRVLADLEWKIIYVGSAESEEFDQILDSVLVGPVPAGRHMFVFQADAPNPSLIPESDAVGVTVVLITCTYHRQEFIRVGYYVNNEYPSPELRENPPLKPDFSQVWLPLCLLQRVGQGGAGPAPWACSTVTVARFPQHGSVLAVPAWYRKGAVSRPQGEGWPQQLRPHSRALHQMSQTPPPWEPQVELLTPQAQAIVDFWGGNPRTGALWLSHVLGGHRTSGGDQDEG
uniref:Anti-silencing function 1B histone chaperone n=1 Tax=Oryctolagus cuniculus TaxID=9986 RepID=A0A5F9DL43_RABIT